MKSLKKIAHKPCRGRIKEEGGEKYGYRPCGALPSIHEAKKGERVIICIPSLYLFFLSLNINKKQRLPRIDMKSKGFLHYTKVFF